MQEEDSGLLTTLEMLLNVPTGQTTVKKQNRFIYLECSFLRSA